MLIVAGYLRVTDRDRYLEACREVVEQAREAPGCLDFTLGADLLEPDRVNVYERWTNRAAVEVFRGEGTSGELDIQITAADVREFDCTGRTRSTTRSMARKYPIVSLLPLLRRSAARQGGWHA
ncbi:antibiotic biosynthesis monooxygenase family protein, partial [Nocardia cyriacigeorgica]|uniref:putative quinol monooxygenase n=1 Tax=Nocardia cyriacigeorgica TaxID=135487 RepID=UPI00313CFC0B